VALLLLLRCVLLVRLALRCCCRCALLLLLRVLRPFPCAPAHGGLPWPASGGCLARLRAQQRLGPPLQHHLLLLRLQA
jgi:hypothetical protein